MSISADVPVTSDTLLAEWQGYETQFSQAESSTYELVRSKQANFIAFIDQLVAKYQPRLASTLIIPLLRNAKPLSFLGALRAQVGDTTDLAGWVEAKRIQLALPELEPAETKKFIAYIDLFVDLSKAIQ
jgi:hypothetical protein